MREKRQKMQHESRDDVKDGANLKYEVRNKSIRTTEKDETSAIEQLPETKRRPIVDEVRLSKSQEKTANSEMAPQEETLTRRDSTELDRPSKLNDDNNKGDGVGAESSTADEDDLDRQLAEIDALINS